MAATDDTLAFVTAASPRGPRTVPTVDAIEPSWLRWKRHDGRAHRRMAAPPHR
ncbi:MAG: hypothetical protein IT370_30740 [Deltaproteobacteria bacterium]|nr:hypothetical protein [Deltaproteobacteria bacterium]